MKITALVEDSEGNVIGIFIDDTPHRIDPPVPRCDLARLAAALAEQNGYRWDPSTMTLTHLAPPLKG
jgi:hypothetical protein